MNKQNKFALFLSVVLAVLMVVSIFPFGALAAVATDPEFDASTLATDTSKPDTGNPNWGDPETEGNTPAGQVPSDYTPAEGAIGITTADEFYAMADFGNYYLAADLTGENAIETALSGFYGTFDGMGHTIELKGDSLFNKPTNATIQNFTLTGNVVSTKWGNTGAVARGDSTNCTFFNICNYASVTMPTDPDVYAYAVASTDATTGEVTYSTTGYEDDPTTAIREDLVTNGDFRAAAIAGRTKGYCYIERCVNYGYMEGSQYVGGLISYPSPDALANGVNEGQLYIADSYNHGDVYSVYSIAAGIAASIAGRGNSAYTGSDNRGHRFVNVHNTGNVTSMQAQASGILGELIANASDMVFENCSNSGTITGRNNVAGILGTRQNAGYNAQTLLYACVNTGDITSTNGRAGGFVGYGYGAGTDQFMDLRFCLNTGDVTGVTAATLGIAYCNSAYNIIYNCVFSGTATAANSGDILYDSVLVNTGAAYVNSAYLINNYVAPSVTNVAVCSGTTTDAPVNPTVEDYSVSSALSYLDVEEGMTEDEAVMALYHQLLADEQAAIADPYVPTDAADFVAAITGDPFGHYGIEGKLDLTTVAAEVAYITVDFYGTLQGLTEDAELVISSPVFRKTFPTATVKDLKLSGAVTSTNAQVGSIAIFGGGLYQNIHNTASVTATSRAGGLISNPGHRLLIDHCTNSGAVTATAGEAGGILGYSNVKNTFVSHCENTGTVSATTHVGGIVSEFQAENASIVDCVNRGKVVTTANANGTGAGGILGYNGTSFIQIYGCVNYGAVQGACQVAGILGDSAKGFIMNSCTNYGPIDSTYTDSHNTRAAAGIFNHHHDGGLTKLVIENCTNLGDINCDESIAVSAGRLCSAGGIAGFIGNLPTGFALNFYNCINVGNVYSAMSIAGGIIGTRSHDKSALDGTLNMYGCFNFGSVTSAGLKDATRKAGGLVGNYGPEVVHTIVIDHCGNLGDVTGYQSEGNVGGYFGYLYHGGSETVTITNSIIGGTITNTYAGSYASGVVGYSNTVGIKVQNSYFSCVLVDGNLYAGTTDTNTHAYLIHSGNGAYTTSTSNVKDNVILTPGGYAGTGATAHSGGSRTDSLPTAFCSAFTFTEAEGAAGWAKLGNNATGLGFVAEMGAAHAIALAKASTTAQANIVAAINNNFGTELESLDANVVEVYDAEGTLVDTVASLSEAAALLGEGYTVKLVTEYFGVHDETVNVEGGISWTLDGNSKNIYLFHDKKDGGTGYGFGINFTGNSNITMKNATFYANYRAVKLDMDGTVELLGVGIYAGGVLSDGTGLSTLNASTALDIRDRNLVVTIGAGSEVANRSNAVINVYGGLVVEDGGKVTNKFTSNLLWIQNSAYGLPVILNGADMHTGGTFMSILNIGTHRYIDIIGGSLSSEDNYAVFGINYTVARATMRLFEVDLTINDDSNIFSGHNATRERTVGGTPIYGNNGTIEMYSGTLTKAADTDSRMVKYYGSQDFKFYGGTLNNYGKSDLLAMDLDASASADTKPVTNIVFGNPGNLTVPYGQTVAPLVAYSTHYAFVIDASNTAALQNAEVNVEFYGTQDTTQIKAETRLVSIPWFTDASVKFYGGSYTTVSDNVIHFAQSVDTVDLDYYNAAAEAKIIITGDTKLVSTSGAAIYTGKGRLVDVTIKKNVAGTPSAEVQRGMDLRHFGTLYINGLDLTAQTYGLLITNTRQVIVDDINLVCGLIGVDDATEKHYALSTYSNTTYNCKTPNVVTLNGGSWVNKCVGDAVISIEGVTENETVATINGGYYEGIGMCVVRALGGKTAQEFGEDNYVITATTMSITINGGVFINKGNTLIKDQSHYAVVRTGGGSTYGTVILNGGTYINQSIIDGVVESPSEQCISRNNTCSTLEINGGRYLVNGFQNKFLLNAGDATGDMPEGYTPSCNYEAIPVVTDEDGLVIEYRNVTVTYGGEPYYFWTVSGADSEEFAMALKAGAALRTTQDQTGIRFTSYLTAAEVAAAVAYAGEGGTVSYGTVIAPMNYVKMLEGKFTMANLDAYKAAHSEIESAVYVNIPATSVGTQVDEEGNVSIRAALVGIKPQNVELKFAAIPYIMVEKDGEDPQYFYGQFDSYNNSRCAKEIAEAFFADQFATAPTASRTNGVYVEGVLYYVNAKYTDAQIAAVLSWAGLSVEAYDDVAA